MALTKISTAMISQSAAAVDLNVDAGTFYVDTTNNRVGVGGKTDPDTPLHVIGTATATTFAGSGASLTSIPNSALVNSSITINSTAVSLGGSLTLTTANIAENTNLYYTDARADARIAAADTDDLSEGSSNLYYTDARVDARVSGGSLGNITTTGYIRGPATFTLDPAAHGDDTGTVVIAGNLQVDGTTTTINSTTMTVDDKNITLASGSANAAAASGAGFTVDIGSGTLPAITYDGTNDEWDFNKPLNVQTNLLLSSDGSNGIISESGAGSLFLRGSGVSIQNASNANMIQALSAGAVTLYHNGAPKIATSSTGITVTGSIAVSGNVDGVDIAARDAVLTSTTTTAGAALPKAGGTITGTVVFNSAPTFNTAIAMGSTLNVASSIGIAGTTVIDSSRNLTNIGTISTSGQITQTVAGSNYFRSIASSSGNAGLYMQNTARNWYVLNNSAGGFEIYDGTASAVRLGINTSGTVSIAGSISSGAITSTGLTSQLNGNGGLPVSSGTSQTYGSLRVGATSFATILDMGTAGATGAWLQASDKTALGTNYSLLLNPNGGNVGIGTSSPNDAKLQVFGNSSSDWGGYFYNQNAGGIGLHVETNSYGTEQLLRLSSLTGSGGSNTVRMVVRADGNVGIGDSTPSVKLDVYQSTAGTGAADFRHVNGNRILLNPSYNYYDAYNHIFRGLNGTNTHMTIDVDRRLILDATKNYGSGSTFPTYSGIGGYIHAYVNGSGSSYPRYLDIASIGSNGTGNGGNIRLIVNQNSATAGDVVAQFSLSNGSRIHDRLYVGDGPASLPIPSNTLMVRQAETSTTGGPNSGNSYFPIVVGGGTHVAGVAFGIGFDPEGYGNRNKVAIMVEGDGQGYSHGKLHFAINNVINGQNVQIADSKMTILKTGNVGIGTTTPGWQFVVQGAGSGSGLQDGHVMIRSTTAANPAGLMFINSGNTASYNDLGSIQGIVESGNAKGALRFITRNSDGNNTDVAERMRISSDGNVGIGTDSPGSSKLKVYNSTVVGNTQLHIHNDKTGDAAVLRLEGKRTSSNDTGQLLFANNGDIVARIDAVSAADNGSLRFFTSVASTGSSVLQALTITDEGRLLHQNGTNSSRGGNATSALFKLKSGQNYVDIQAASTTSNGGLLFSDGSSGNYGLVDYKHSDDNMLFYTASSEKMRIASNGDMIYGGGTGVHEKTFSGITQGLSTFSHDIVHTSDAGVGTILHIQAAFTHHPSYDCILDTWVSRRTNTFSSTEQFRRDTGTSGSWAVSYVSATVTRITKVAGTYVGGGPYWIKAVWKNYD